MGDGVLIEFSSAAAAVACAIEIQTAMTTAEPDVPDGSRLRYRIGINLGDVIVEGDDIYGEGVNVAARLQALAEVGGIAVSRNVSDQVAGKIAAALDDLGLHIVKNIERPVHVFAVRPPRGDAPAAAPKPAAPATRVSICVMPFDNMSADSEQDFFAAGISEDIITDLGKVSALSVVPRNTSFSPKHKDVPVAQVARNLRVSHALVGSVRKSGNRVRITAHLIEASADQQIWAERWDRDMNDIFALQDEISRAVVAALKLKLLPEEKQAINRRDTQNTDAYQVYLMARQYYVSSNMTDARRSETVIRLCKRAIELDPNFSRAWAMLAIAQRLSIYSGKGGPDGLEAAERALALNPELPEAHAAKISVLISSENHAAAREKIGAALALDPESYEVNKEAARLAYYEKRWPDAIRHYEKAAEMETDFSSLGLLMTCYREAGDPAGVRKAAERTLARVEPILAREPDNGSALAFGIGALGQLAQPERARDWAQRALMLDPDNVNMRYNIACALIVDLGDFEEGLNVLEPALAKFGKVRLAHAVADPDFDPVRSHPRFQAMIKAAQARLDAH
jgi:adenylate cyclase